MEQIEIADEFIIEDLDTLKVLTDNLRVRILRAFGREPRTVKEIAERLDMPHTKLYYHVNLLEKYRIIKVVETRIVSGIIEKIYSVTAKSYRPGAGLLSAVAPSGQQTQIEAMFHSVMQAAQEDVRHSLAKGQASLGEQAPLTQKVDIAYQTLYLTEAELAEFHREMEALLKRLGRETPTPQPDQKAYNLFFLFFPSGD